jgi:uncharacterized protein YjiS (DUF1127 family)
MMPDDGFDPWTRDVRHLTPQQWTALRKDIIARAHAERNRAIERMVAGAFRALRDAWRYRRCRQEARAALCSMTAYELRDIGLSRGDIEGAIRCDDVGAMEDRSRRCYGVLAQTARSRGNPSG